MAESPLVETARIAMAISEYLLVSIDPANLDAQLSGKGRTVAEQFAHLHDVRLMWLRAAAPDLEAGLSKLGKEGLKKERLAESLAASSKAMQALVARAEENGGKVKGFKPHATAFVGYLSAHEAHHRGQVMVTLKHAGAPVDKKVAFGLWEWGSRGAG